MAFLVTTCMGRLEHLTHLVPTVLERTDWSVVVVDWSCPEKAGDWAESLRERRVSVVRGVADWGPRGRLFHTARAKNAGAAAVPREGDPVVVFTNADCLVEDGNALSVLAEGLGEKEAAYVCRSSWSSYCGLGGFLMLRASLFDAVAGFDETLTDWSPDDFEMRIRLHFSGASPSRVDPAWLRLLDHDDALRVRNYANQNMINSMYGAWDRIDEKMRRLWGTPLAKFQSSPEGAVVMDRTDLDGRIVNPGRVPERLRHRILSKH